MHLVLIAVAFTLAAILVSPWFITGIVALALAIVWASA